MLKSEVPNEDRKETHADVRERHVKEARAGYGHVLGRDDIDCLVLCLERGRYLQAARLSVQDLNALQAGKIARRDMLVSKLRKLLLAVDAELAKRSPNVENARLTLHDALEATKR